MSEGGAFYVSDLGFGEHSRMSRRIMRVVVES
jgi:hypothetical protein